MKIRITTGVAALASAVLAPFSLFGAEANHCEEVGNAVRAAVAKEPQKVLVIVEDAMVANESCAANIVKAAIAATKASKELIQQIVLTATHVAPKYADVIAESAGSTMTSDLATADMPAPGGKDAVNVEPVDSGKGVASVAPVAPMAEAVNPPAGSTSDYTVPSDVRGVYLIQPSTGGINTTTATMDKNCDCPTTSTSTAVVHKAPRRSTPQSPSTASQG